jgi:hypothetical protein
MPTFGTALIAKFPLTFVKGVHLDLIAQDRAALDNLGLWKDSVLIKG